MRLVCGPEQGDLAEQSLTDEALELVKQAQSKRIHAGHAFKGCQLSGFPLLTEALGLAKEL